MYTDLGYNAEVVCSTFFSFFCHVKSYHTSVNIFSSHTPDRGFAPFCQTTLWESVLRKKDCPNYIFQRVLDCCANPTSDKLHNSPETVNIQQNMNKNINCNIPSINAVLATPGCHFKNIWISIKKRKQTFTTNCWWGDEIKCIYIYFILS